jgi:hypothetical protein
MRNHNISIIKSRRAYTPSEVGALLNVSNGTVYRWMKEGLRPIKKNTNPLLLYGSELKRFLSARRKNRRLTLQPDEFYCVKCRVPKRADPSSIQVTKTGKQIGKDNREQVQNTAPCKDCGTTMRRFA